MSKARAKKPAKVLGKDSKKGKATLVSCDGCGACGRRTFATLLGEQAVAHLSAFDERAVDHWRALAKLVITRRSQRPWRASVLIDYSVSVGLCRNPRTCAQASITAGLVYRGEEKLDKAGMMLAEDAVTTARVQVNIRGCHAAG